MNDMFRAQVPTVLLVEDLEDDVFFFKHALKRAGVQATLHVGNDGLEAVAYLSHQDPFGDPVRYPRPDLMFLDLKMPNMNGFEVLEWLGQHPIDPPFKVIVLTGSEEPADQARARTLGAHGYLIKPPAPEKLVELFSVLDLMPTVPCERPSLVKVAAPLPPGSP